MPKLSDTQAVLLATAAARSDLSVLPPPETLTLKGAALERTLSALIRRGLIGEAAVERRARKSKWVVEDDDTRKRQRLVITPAGLDALGVEAISEAASAQPGLCPARQPPLTGLRSVGGRAIPHRPPTRGPKSCRSSPTPRRFCSQPPPPAPI